MSLMESFIQAGYTDERLVRLSQVQKHKTLLHLSEMIKCNGVSVEEGFLGDAISMSRKYIFPLEKPTSADFTLWDEAVQNISSPGLILLPCLGKYLQKGHLHSHWFLSEENIQLFLLEPSNVAKEKYDVHEKGRSYYETVQLTESHQHISLQVWLTPKVCMKPVYTHL